MKGTVTPAQLFILWQIENAARLDNGEPPITLQQYLNS